MSRFFPRPHDGCVGDVIPFEHRGEVHLFFLHHRRDGNGQGTPWHRYTTADFATYDYRGVALDNGSAEEPDLNAYTGCLVEDEAGVVHLFYTGQNPAISADGSDEPAQVVLHATSTDGMQTWMKHPDHTLAAPDGYDAANWRDPFVFRPEPGGPWHMLVAGRIEHGPYRRRGVIAGLVSDDLVDWKLGEPFWAPDRYLMLECPEVFRLGDWWYLVYSEFSDHFATRYRMSRSPFGPWESPDRDTVDGRAMYAAKSVEHNGTRYFAGWIPTRAGANDDGPWEWAGNLVAHAATPADNGALRFAMPETVRNSFDPGKELSFHVVLGEWIQGPHLTRPRHDAYGVVVSEPTPETFLLDLTIDIAPETTDCGVILRASDDAEEGYVVRLEPRHGRMVFDRWPRARTGPAQWEISGDVSHLVELERPVPLPPGRHRLTVLVDGTACVTYLDGLVAMSARMYDRRTGRIGLFVGEGSVSFSDLSVATPNH